MTTMTPLHELKSLAFRITSLCNLRCIFCGQYKQSQSKYKSVDQKKYLSLNALISIVEQVIQYKPQIYLWGGEPFIYPYLKEFLYYLRQKKLTVFITTNGVLLKNFYALLTDLKITQITISLDGFKKAHELGRGVSGIYDVIIKNLQLLNKYKNSHNSVFPLVDINVLINSTNYPNLFKFCQYLLNLGFIHLIRLQLPMFFHSSAINEFGEHVSECFDKKAGKSWAYFTDDYQSINMEILKHQIKLSLSLKGVRLFPMIDDIDAWFKSPNIAFQSNCKTAWRRINIEPNGDLIACTDFPETIYGNALNEPIDKLFNNFMIKLHRERISEKLCKLCARCSHLYLYNT
jgi:radical SAM protein with 4Fe4S-binding SPASM domain